MRKILILGAGEFQIPVIQQAKKMGLCTCVMDINPDSVGIPYADHYYQCSLKDSDAALEIAKRIKPDGITTGASDVGVLTCAILCKELNLPGLSVETAKKATDKYLMIDAFKTHGVSCPEYQYIKSDELDSFELKLDFPVISKPVDMSASRGIALSRTMDELKVAVEESSRIGCAGDILVEEFMTGPEVSVEIIVKDGMPRVIQVTDKITTGAPHFIEYGHTQPTSLPDDIVEDIKKVACGAAKAVGIVNGTAHAEVMITANGAKMVEIGARMGGDSIQEQLLELSTGINMPEIAIKIALGDEFLIPSPSLNKSSAIRFLLAKEGEVKSIGNLDFLKDIKEVKYYKLQCQIGEHIENAQDNSGRIFYIIAQAETPQGAGNICEEALRKVKIQLS